MRILSPWVQYRANGDGGFDGGFDVKSWRPDGTRIPRWMKDVPAPDVNYGMVGCGDRVWVLVGSRHGDTLHRYEVTSGVGDPELTWAGPGSHAGNPQYFTGCHGGVPAVGWKHSLSADDFRGWVLTTW